MRKYGFQAREITIKPRGSEETMTFDSMTKLSHFLETGSVTLHNFLEGRSKFNELYEIVSYDGKPVDESVNGPKKETRGRKNASFKLIKIQNLWTGDEKEFHTIKEVSEYMHVTPPTVGKFIRGDARCCSMFKLLELQK